MKQANKLKILFLCTGNSCRSQMAEGWVRQLKAEVIEPYSAGIETHGLNPNAVKVMAETGVDISAHRSKLVSDLMDINFDYVVTVCGHASENCPIFPGKVKVVHFGFDDPPKLAEEAKTEEQALDCYRRVRDEIKQFVHTLPEALNKYSKKGIGMLDEKIKELIAIGASVSCNCHPCVKFHVDKARKFGIEAKHIEEALKVGIMIRTGAAGQMDKLLSEVSGELGVSDCNGKQS